MPVKSETIEGVGVVHFPDAMSQQEIDTAIKDLKQRVPPPPSPVSRSGQVNVSVNAGLPPDTAKNGLLRPPGSPSPPPQPNDPHALDAVDDALGGVASGMGSSLVGGYDALRRVPGLSKILPPPPPSIESIREDPKTATGRFFKNVEQAAEYLIPIPGIKKLELLGKGAGLVKMGTRMATEALHAAPIATAQSGGKASDVAGTMAVASASPLAAKAIEAMGTGAKMAAQKIYESVFSSPGAVKPTIKASAEGLIDHGYIALTKGRMEDKAATELQSAWTRIKAAEDAAVNNPSFRAGSASGKTLNMVPPGQIEMKPIIEDFQKEINQKFLRSGKLPTGLEDEYGQYQKMLGELQSRGQFAPVKDIIYLKRDWDAAVKEYDKLGELTAKKNAMGAAANSIRTELGKWIPDLKQPNADYSFWAGVKDLIEKKIKAQVGGKAIALDIAGKAGAAGVGYAHGGTTEAIQAMMLLGALHSTAGKTVSAVGLNRIGRLMSAGDTTTAIKELSMLMGGSATEGPPPPSEEAPRQRAQTAPPPPTQ